MVMTGGWFVVLLCPHYSPFMAACLLFSLFLLLLGLRGDQDPNRGSRELEETHQITSVMGHGLFICDLYMIYMDLIMFNPLGVEGLWLVG